MKKTILYLVVLFSFFSCNNDDDNPSEFQGTYYEITPVENRTQIKFTSNTDLTIIKSENTSDQFKYEISGDNILLTHESQSQSQSFEFVKISSSEFKIQNLYADIPENGISYMTFKK
ncbi:hypothetical protein [Psychroflexus sediminis]|uniref:Lipocalin-like domain-containing protein n=1 Tax=Psychroflexus sediminis TaxID=470826 RepID=A0A1G7ZIX1_9FLAO|nr:hypothetical protein [Psychroflexus sediminis]SDH08731.1 hypothetical protein SAMN04488027_1305 [Psychroflexus sediminis]